MALRRGHLECGANCWPHAVTSWYTKPDDAVEYAAFFSRSHDAVIRVYDDAGNVIEAHEHAGEFKEP